MPAIAKRPVRAADSDDFDTGDDKFPAPVAEVLTAAPAAPVAVAPPVAPPKEREPEADPALRSSLGKLFPGLSRSPRTIILSGTKEEARALITANEQFTRFSESLALASPSGARAARDKMTFDTSDPAALMADLTTWTTLGVLAASQNTPEFGRITQAMGLVRRAEFDRLVRPPALAFHSALQREAGALVAKVRSQERSFTSHLLSFIAVIPGGPAEQLVRREADALTNLGEAWLQQIKQQGPVVPVDHIWTPGTLIAAAREAIAL